VLPEFVLLYAKAYRPSWNSESAWASVLIDAGGSVLAERTGYQPGKSLSGSADYRAVVAGLQDARALGVALVVIQTSSNLVFDQMTDQRPVLGVEFLSLVRRVDHLAEQFASVAGELVSADRNRADPLARRTG
jgi:ribonuclease HI